MILYCFIRFLIEPITLISYPNFTHHPASSFSSSSRMRILRGFDNSETKVFGLSLERGFVVRHDMGGGM